MRPDIHQGNEDPRSEPTCQQSHEASETAQSSQYLEFNLLKSSPASLLPNYAWILIFPVSLYSL